MENKIKGSSQQVRWTAEDLDTVRHESHHLTQDCRDNSLNGRLHAYIMTPLDLLLLSCLSLGNRIIDNYADRGEHVVIMELEAFAVAAMNDPLEQVE